MELADIHSGVDPLVERKSCDGYDRGNHGVYWLLSAMGISGSQQLNEIAGHGPV